MSYDAKLDWIDYDEQNPDNPDAIPKAQDLNRIEQGILNAHNQHVNKNGDTMTGALTLPGDPINDLHAAPKQYVDAVKQGLDPKDSVRVATNSNVDLATGGLLTIDGVTLSEGDRVLVKNQTTASENGIYNASSGSWTRTLDADNNPDGGEVTTGMYCFVEEGDTNINTGWMLSTIGDITLDTTDLTFIKFSGAGQITAGEGLSKEGDTLALSQDTQTRLDNINTLLWMGV